jgi:tetratricopeptide (TPR) repeat protein
VARKWSIAGIVLIVMMVIVSYLPAVQSNYIWDDDDYVTQNETLRSTYGLYQIWFDVGSTPQYYPLVHTTFWLEYRLWGLNAAGYHITNILLHATNALLLWLLLCRLSIRGAWLAAAVFALHPVHVESVAWITERKNVLSGCFYLLAMLSYIQVLGLTKPLSMSQESRVRNNFYLYLLALLLYLCALLSKTVTCTFPVAILLIMWWKRGSLSLRDCLPLLPFFIIGAGLGLQTVWIEKYGVGARGEEFAYTMVERFLIAGRALWFYLEKLFWPQQLTFFYPRWNVNESSFLQYLFPLSFVALLLVAVLFQKKLGRSTAVALLFYGVTLFPALGFFNVAPMRFSYVADHFQYLASIGPIVLSISLLIVLFKKFPIVQKGTGAVGVGLVLIILGMLTMQQSKIYNNAETLWKDTIAKNPHSWISYMNLGVTLSARGEFEEALECYRQALRVNPDSAWTHNNIGTMMAEMGKPDLALYHMREALRLKADYPEAYSNLGIIFARQMHYSDAAHYLQMALKLAPENAWYYYNLGLVLHRQEKLQEAAYCYKQALRFDPDRIDALRLLKQLEPEV